jgi:hypothetical protein
MELARYPSDRLFKLIWMVSQPIAKYHDVGFPSGVLAIASHILQNGLNIELQDEVDFESKWYQAAAQRGVVEATDWNVEGSRVGIDWNVEGVDGKGVLHTEKERPWSKPWDVFISHASEDKAQLVRPLADALKEYGVKVWYDSFSMQPGSNLGHSIDAGIAAAEFGIIVLSPRFIAKEWPRYEFDALCQRRTEQGGRLIILWHTLAQEDRPEWTRALDLEKCLDTATQPLTGVLPDALDQPPPHRRTAHEIDMCLQTHFDRVSEPSGHRKRGEWNSHQGRAAPQGGWFALFSDQSRLCRHGRSAKGGFSRRTQPSTPRLILHIRMRIGDQQASSKQPPHQRSRLPGWRPSRGAIRLGRSSHDR